MSENNGTWSKSEEYYLYKIGDSEKFSIRSCIHKRLRRV